MKKRGECRLASLFLFELFRTFRAVLEDHSLEGGLCTEVEQHAHFGPSRAQRIQKLFPMRFVEGARGFHLHHDCVGDEEIGAIAADARTTIEDVDWRLADEWNGLPIELDRERVAVDGFEESVAECVVHAIERVDDATRGVSVEQSWLGHEFIVARPWRIGAISWLRVTPELRKRRVAAD